MKIKKRPSSDLQSNEYIKWTDRGFFGGFVPVTFFIKARILARRNEFLKRFLKKLLFLVPTTQREKIHRATLEPFNKAEVENKIIFIHIPKTAGKSVYQSLFGKDFSSHQIILNYKKFDEKRFHEYFKFAIVRNPWDRFASAFSYLKSSKSGLSHTKEDAEFSRRYLMPYENLSEFIYALGNDKKMERKIIGWTHFIPQYKYICDDNGEIAVDFVGKYERLKEDFDFIKNKIGLGDRTLLRVNSTGRRENYVSQYSDQTAQIIDRIYKVDIELFDYDFPLKGDTGCM